MNEEGEFSNPASPGGEIAPHLPCLASKPGQPSQGKSRVGHAVSEQHRRRAAPIQAVDRQRGSFVHEARYELPVVERVVRFAVRYERIPIALAPRMTDPHGVEVDRGARAPISAWS